MAKTILYTGLDPNQYQAQAAGQLIHCPLIEIVPRPVEDPAIQQAFKKFSAYTHVLITSKSTVKILKNLLPQFSLSLEEWKQKKTLAVGQVTAKHLLACGIEPVAVAAEETAEGLIVELQKLPLKGAFIFWPHSSQSRPVLSDFLQQSFLAFQDCSLYDTQTRHPSNLPSIDSVDEIVFTSPSTVEAFIQLYGALPRHKVLTSIGPVTEECLNRRLSSFPSLLA